MFTKTNLAASAASLILIAGASIVPASAQSGHHTKNYAALNARLRAEKAAHYAQIGAHSRTEKSAHYAQIRAESRAEKAAHYASLRHHRK